ncbi:uncharacterized protein LOC114940669 [Nylanderia fulva]|uniref:uncharacterized protein LOC114940669 n=1 Tax=Nylanderia fulva TaxID=613905 RepID=UPI0010FAF3B9|nr:uncharacterized protein LOC114940669 [Nylanderia fulva]
MNPVPAGASRPSVSYYLPHHAVFKADDPSGKIRVVFNASFRTSSDHSLNDCLLPGPRLQSDLWIILTRWRKFLVGFMADIVKMKSFIRVNPEDVDLQRILWRASPAESVREFRSRRIFLQDLWLAGYGWDDPLPPELTEAWGLFRASLPGLAALQIPRWLQVSPEDKVELHGFSDASERAYAAAVYVRVTKQDRRVEVTLLTARTKVAPIKTQSVPRLELCGAVLLARLLRRVARDLDMEGVPVVAWTDARVVLCWLRSHASRWRPFVAHRVAELQDLIPSDQWRYVPTAANPADLATRGIPVSELLGLNLWWRGPGWLRDEPSTWPVTGDLGSHHEEEERRVIHLAVPEEREKLIEDRFSTLTRLVRVVAYCYRFFRRARGVRDRSGFMTSAELEASLLVMVRVAQRQEFLGELGALTAGGPLPSGSPLRALSPLLDENGSLQVGGRLQSAQLPFSKKHPLILPREGHLTELVLRDAHAATLHGGLQLMRNYLLCRFWIVGVAA